MTFSPSTKSIPAVNPIADFEIGIKLLAERTPSSGDLIFKNQMLPCNYRPPAVGWLSRRQPETGIILLQERTQSSGDFMFEGQVRDLNQIIPKKGIFTRL